MVTATMEGPVPSIPTPHVRSVLIATTADHAVLPPQVALSARRLRHRHTAIGHTVIGHRRRHQPRLRHQHTAICHTLICHRRRHPPRLRHQHTLSRHTLTLIRHKARVPPARHRWVHFAVTTTQPTLITFAVRALLVVVVSVFLQEVRFVAAADRITALLVRPVVATLVVLPRHFVVAMRIRALVPATLFLDREIHSRVVRRP